MSSKARIKRLADEHLATQRQHILVEGCNFLINDGKDQPYKPNKTGEAFHKSDSLVRLEIGPYGSGKSTTCCAEIVLRACAMPKCKDGVRHSRWCIVRNTYGDLKTTSLKTWSEWFGYLGALKTNMDAPISYVHTFNDGQGIIRLEMLFLALDRPQDIRRLKSLELTGVYLNELAEIPQAALKHFMGRISRYPAKRNCDKPYWSGIIADTNPPEVDHWVYKLFEIIRPKTHEILHQPPAVLKVPDGYEINPEAENLEHLPGGAQYYINMMSGQTEEFIKVYVMGQYGTVVEGQFVYNNYNDDLHSVEDIDIDPDYPLAIGVDYGTISPAILLGQLVEGQFRCIKEFVCEYMTVKELYTSAVQPFLATYCDGMTLEICVGDPADTYDGREQLADCGLEVDSAKTNTLEPRIRSVRDRLNTLVLGIPTIVISRKGCPKLRQGFLGKYHYRRLRVIGEEKYKDEPNKNHPYSDIHDCLQYICMQIADVDFMEEDEPVMPWELTREEGKSDVTGY